MFGIQELGLFVTTAILLNLTPGPDTLYIVGRSVAQGKSSGIASVIGISLGSLVHTFAAALGLSAIIVTSAWVFMTIKILGAVYLIYIGFKILASRSSSSEIPKNFKESDFFNILKQGFLTNLLNPKVAIFFLALVPQFISADSPSKFISFIVLGLCFITTGTLWCFCLVLLSSSFSKRLRESAKFSRMLDRISGGLFIALGIKLGITK